jgi:hypothetical protein
MLLAVLVHSVAALGQSANQPAASSSAQAVKALPDAQVEASVLKALAAAPDLTNQQMTTTTVYGVVTLSGSVESEALRTEAETIVSKTQGVQKVVDEMTLSGEGSTNAVPEGSSAAVQPADQSSAPVVQGSPESNNTQPDSRPSFATRTSPVPQPVYGGQEAGIAVTIPTGALLRMRINQTLTSESAKPGDPFDGIVVNDVVADGAVAIPRGAAVHGSVTDVKKAGVFSGRGELSLQLTQVTLGGKIYPITSDVWGHNGGDKSTETVNKTAVGGAIGALFGAAAAGGKGAAVGAGVGGALGLGSAASSGNGQVYVPSEGLLTFHLAQPATVATVSQAEMDRLAQGVPGMAPQRLVRRYPPGYYGPVYYRPYPYPY